MQGFLSFSVSSSSSSVIKNLNYHLYQLRLWISLSIPDYSLHIFRSLDLYSLQVLQSKCS